MLPPHQQSKNSPNGLTCDCNVFGSSSSQDQNEIFIKKNRTYCLFSSQARNQYPKIYVSNREKQSLRLIRPKKAKQNSPAPAVAGEVSALDKTVTKTDLMTHTDSQNIKTINDYRQLNLFSCFSSYVFKDSAFVESKDVFGRLINEVKDVEQTSKSQNEHLPASRSCTNTNIQNNVVTSNRERIQSFSFIETKDRLAPQFCRHARSQSGLVVSSPNFFSQQHLKNQILQSIDFERQVSSIVLKKKTTQRTRHLQQLNFKDTESINGQSSESMSEVISDESQQNIGNVQFSHIIVPKPKWQRFSAMPKLSNFK